MSDVPLYNHDPTSVQAPLEIQILYEMCFDSKHFLQ